MLGFRGPFRIGLYQKIPVGGTSGCGGSLDALWRSARQLRALHSKFDQNHDGKVSLSEVLPSHLRAARAMTSCGTAAQVLEFAKHMSKAIAGKDVNAILEEIDSDKASLVLSCHFTLDPWPVRTESCLCRSISMICTPRRATPGRSEIVGAFLLP